MPLALLGACSAVKLAYNNGHELAWWWLTDLVSAGTALATDYGHVRAERGAAHRHGTLTAYRAGRLARPATDTPRQQ